MTKRPRHLKKAKPTKPGYMNMTAKEQEAIKPHIIGLVWKDEHDGIYGPLWIRLDNSQVILNWANGMRAYDETFYAKWVGRHFAREIAKDFKVPIEES